MSKPKLIRRIGQNLLNVLPAPISDSLRAGKRAVLNRRQASEVFGDIYNGNSWDGTESVSGPGSTLAATANIRLALPILIKELGIKSILDVPCGDAYWIGECLPDNIAYTGGDIVPKIIEKNRQEKSDLGKFIVCNLVTDPLPAADLIIVRDCFIHLPNKMIIEAINNIRKSEVKYILTTTYQDTQESIDIELGGFRSINLSLKPFSLPKPIQLISESGESDKGGKSMGLWECKDLILN